MRATETVRTAWRSLLANRMRTSLTALGIVIGVAAVVAVVAIGEGARASVEDRIRALGSNLVVVRPGSRGRGPVRTAASSESLVPGDASAIAELAGVLAVAPLATGSAQVRYLEQNISASILGITADYFTVRALEVERGLGLSDLDDRQRRRVAVIGTGIEDELFGEGGSALGERIQIRGVAFRVIGVLEEQGSNGFDSTDDQVFVPRETHEGVLFGQSHLSAIYLTVADEGETSQVEARISSLLRLRHRLHVDDEDDFNLFSQTQMLETMSAITGVLTALLAAVAAVSLVVGGIGIMNIMLVSVRERTREIGVRMAVGARRRDILLQFLVESVAVSVFGGILGVLLGFLLAYVIARVGGWDLVVPLYAVVVALGVSFGVGVVFGVGPARSASRLDPVEALRHE